MAKPTEMAIEALVQALDVNAREGGLVRPAAIEALSKAGEAALPHLEAALRDPARCGSAALVLGAQAKSLRTDAVARLAASGLGSSVASVRSEMLSTLGTLGDVARGQLPVVVSLVGAREPVAEVRARALWAMSVIAEEGAKHGRDKRGAGVGEAIQVAAKALRGDDDPVVKAEAARTLARLLPLAGGLGAKRPRKAKT